MHNRRPAAPYADFVKEVSAELLESVDIALAASIARDKIIIDPGIGFGGKSVEQNLACIKHVSDFAMLGYPVLIGASNKSFIGQALGGAAISERLAGTLAANIIAIKNGASIIRVHDVKAHRDALDVMFAL